MIDARAETLVADCANCVGLCCVALAFVRSDDFAFSKSDDEACRNLDDDYRCRIHPDLRAAGMKGCTVFDCHGAGQRVTRQVFDGASWRDSSSIRNEMFAVFRVVRQLHDMLWYLAAAARATNDAAVQETLEAEYGRIDAAASQPGELIVSIELEQFRDEVNPLLAVVSESVRRDAHSRRTGPLPRRAHSGADLVGTSWAGQDLRGADLRGALLIAADLAGADLRAADLLAADLRDTNVRGADLSTTLFVTQMQLNAAMGDGATRLPPQTNKPAHWD